MCVGGEGGIGVIVALFNEVKKKKKRTSEEKKREADLPERNKGNNNMGGHLSANSSSSSSMGGANPSVPSQLFRRHTHTHTIRENKEFSPSS